jgi:hypothetical protein
LEFKERRESQLSNWYKVYEGNASGFFGFLKRSHSPLHLVNLTQASFERAVSPDIPWPTDGTGRPTDHFYYHGVPTRVPNKILGLSDKSPRHPRWIYLESFNSTFPRALLEDAEEFQELSKLAELEQHDLLDKKTIYASQPD